MQINGFFMGLGQKQALNVSLTGLKFKEDFLRRHYCSFNTSLRLNIIRG